MAVTMVMILLTLMQNAFAENVVVNTNYGAVKGLKQNVGGNPVDVFLGIPFAKPPIKNLRFVEPEPMDPWQTERDALNLPPCCFQVIDTLFDRFSGVEMWNANTEMSEDCLYLNIWAPSGATSLATIVYIFGGGFFAGSGTLDLYNGAVVAAENNVILVTINYRVGPLGFLYLNTTDAPGNAGLLDQVLGLKWVHENIALFGGDPTKVTIAGESAGAASVSHHLMSPLSKQYFSYAIMHSGSSFCYWSLWSTQTALDRAKKLAVAVSCPSDNADAMYTCLRDTDASTLTDGQWSPSILDYYFDVPFGPVVDGYFLPEDPQAILDKSSEKRTNILIGVVENEDIYFQLYGLSKYIKLTNPNPLTKDEFLDAVNTVSLNADKAIVDAILFEYVDKVLPPNRMSYRQTLDAIGSDRSFKCPSIRLANAYAANSDVFVYDFAHRSTQNPWPEWAGVMHGYELEFFFGVPLRDNSNYTDEEKTFSTRMMKYWTNMAKTGNPNNDTMSSTAPMTWPVYNADTKDYVILNLTESTGMGLRHEECAFWNSYIPKLRKTVSYYKEITTTSACTRPTSSAVLGIIILALMTAFNAH